MPPDVPNLSRFGGEKRMFTMRGENDKEAPDNAGIGR